MKQRSETLHLPWISSHNSERVLNVALKLSDTTRL